MPESVYFISSLLIVGTGIFRFNKKAISKSSIIIFAAVSYSVFCFVAFGKVKGFIPTMSIASLISQQGYDCSRLPISISYLTRFGLICGIAFNIFTALWLVLKRKFWNYCLISAILFCIVGLAMGTFIGINPIYSLFGLCCGFMAAVGWVLGLSYIEFCVLGNIYVPAIALICSITFMLFGVRNTTSVKGIIILMWAVSQIVIISILVFHYFGNFKIAFSQCVTDLLCLARLFHTSYEVVNIVIYVLVIPIILALNIIIGKNLNYKKSENA